MGENGAPRAAGAAKKVLYIVAGLVILAIAIFAVLNVHRIEAWGSGLAGVIDPSRPILLPVALLVAFLAGILTSLTPCVYPVVPLAVTYLGARSATSRLRAFSLASVYVAGMVICYTALGTAAAMTGSTFGKATQKWWIYAGVATVVLLFGLSMLGLFNIQLPSWLSKVAGKSTGPGYKGAFLMGATSGLVTAPCTAPVLGVLLAIAAGRSAAIGSLLLAVFGLGMGMLFLVVGTYASILASLPRSGRWMNVVKIGLGVVIIGVAMYFYYEAWQKLPAHGSAPSTEHAREAAFGGFALPAAAREPARAGQGEGHAAEKAERQAPDVSVVDIKGRRHDLRAYRGKTLHLVFFAVWCPPCVEQMKRVELANARFLRRGYRVLVVGAREREDESRLREFADKRQTDLAMAWDRDGLVAAAFGVDSVPFHVIVGPSGTILYQGWDLPEGFERDGAGLLGP